MSIALTEYINCGHCNYPHIGRAVIEEYFVVHNGLALVEVTIQIICLRCGSIQSVTTHIREVTI